MSHTAIIPLISFLAAGAGYLAADFITGDDPAPTLAEKGSPATDLGVTGDSIRDSLDDFAMRLSTLEARKAMTEVNRRPASAADDSLEQEIASLRDLLASFKSVEVAPPARFQDMVELAIETREERQEVEREVRRAEQREERLDRTMDDLTTKLGLGPGQASDLRTVLTDRNQERDEFFRQMRDPASTIDRGSIRDLLSEKNKTYDAQIQTILSPQQWEQYGAMDTGGMGGFGGGRGRGNRDG